MLSISDFLNSFMPLFLRALGAVLFLPVGNGLTGILSKFSLASTLTVLFVRFNTAPLDMNAVSIFGEIFIGVIIAFPAVLLTTCISMIGDLFDTLRGQNIAQQYDPYFETQSSQVSILLQSYSWAVLLLVGYFELLFNAFGESLRIIPCCGLKLDSLLTYTARLSDILITYLGGMTAAFLPFAIICVLLNLLSGFIGKLMPQLSLNGEVFMVKTAIGMLALVGLAEYQVSPLLSQFAAPLVKVLSP